MWRTLKADRFSQPADRFALAAMTTWMLEFVVERRTPYSSAINA